MKFLWSKRGNLNLNSMKDPMTGVNDIHVHVNVNCTHTSQEIDYPENLMIEDHL